jgi:sarcosine oxidase, subunit beta
VENGTPRQTDIVIIGSGIVGLSTAFHLAGMGQRNVVVFDRGPLGGVASPRAAGSIRHHYSHPMLVELAMRGHQFFRDFHKHTGASCGYTNNGYIVGVGEDQEDWLEENVRMVREVGINTGLVSRREVRDLFPQLDDEGWSGPLAYDRDSAYVQPQDVMRELARATGYRGVTLIPGTAISGIDVQAGRVRGVETEFGDHVLANNVINAAGAWGGLVGRQAGVDVPMSVRRLLQIFELRPGYQVPVIRPTLSDGPLDLYARPNPGNRILVGARHYFDAPMSPDDVQLVPDYSTMADTRTRYERLNPETSTASIYQAWAGIDGDTPDFQPVVGPTPGVDGLITAAGFSAHGFKLGPIIGQLLAELIIHGEYRTQDITRLGFERYQTGDLFPPGYKQMGA